MPSSFSWSTSNTKEAACFASLGFTYSIDHTEDCVHDNPTGEVLVQWIIHDRNVITPTRRLEPLVKQWCAKGLHALHPLMIRWRACHNYDLVLDYQAQGRRLRLVSTANDQAFEYRDGAERLELRNAPTGFQLSELNLAAALAEIGVPIINIEGQPGSRTYTLPQFGIPRLINNEWRTEDASALVTRATPGKLDLVLETAQPDHPLVHAYNALHVWAQLRHAFKQHRKTLLIRFPRFTQRRAVISECADNRVLDRVRRHLKLPPK